MPNRQRPADATSTTLIARVQRRDDEAWNRLVRIYGPLVHGWCTARVPYQDVEDVEQEILQAISRTIGNFQPDGVGASFRRWLRTITSSKINEYYRKHASCFKATGGTTALIRINQHPDLLSATSSDELADELRQIAHRALALLKEDFSETTWTAFCQVVIDGQTPADVATSLNLSPNSVYQAKSRVLKRLREELGELPTEFK